MTGGMTNILMIIILALYTVSVLFLFFYSISQAYLVIKYISTRRKTYRDVLGLPDSNLPSITIQLPLYNEIFVAERIIDAAINLDYPAHKKQIQILDDSDDETTSIIERKIAPYKKSGINIQHICRRQRTGFKAGALRHALALATGEYIAIFDADFIPPKDFLQKALPHFSDKNIGMVQTRWEHINRNQSLLTELQAFGLDAHFRVEQTGRNEANCFMNFNGTGGVWRKECILDAGNWEADTLTEDLDLSYRAQLKGWKFKYLENLAAPAELPPIMSALKSQQYRWTKGGAETARKHLKNVLKSKMPFVVKWQAIAHLLNSAVFVNIILCALLSIPILFIKNKLPELGLFYDASYVFMLSFIVIASTYMVTCIADAKTTGQGVWYFTKTFPLFIAMALGLSLHHAIAVIEGYAGRKTPFIRTPKFNVGKGLPGNLTTQYADHKISFIAILEGITTLIFLTAICFDLLFQDVGMLAFHFMLALGFSMVVYHSFPSLNLFSGKLKAA